jgi:alpha-L-fucosidase
VFYHNLQLAEARWGGSESGTVPYPCWATFPNPYSHGGDTQEERMELLKHGDPNGKYWMPAMSDAPLRGYNGRHEWFWEPGDDTHIYPVMDLMNMYVNSVGHNSTLILGLTPDSRGLLPDADVQRLKEWGEAINQRFSNPIASVHGEGKEMFVQLLKKQKVNQLVIQENVKNGERIRKYKVQALVKGKWEEVCNGQSVGNKRIQKFETVTTNRIRLLVTDAVAIPQIKNFSIFYINENDVSD